MATAPGVTAANAVKDTSRKIKRNPPNGAADPTRKGVKDAAAQAGVAWDFVLSHPDVYAVFQKALPKSADNPTGEDWLNAGAQGQANFQRAIKETSWYQDNSAYARNYLFDQSQASPEDLENRREDARNAVEQRAIALGAVLDDAALDTMAETYLMEGWYESDRQMLLDQALTGELEGFDTDYLNYSKGGPQAIITSLKQAARENGVQYDDSYFNGAARMVLSGMATAEDYLAEIQDKAAGLYPIYGDRIRQGESARSIASPYVRMLADTFELDENTVDLNDPYIRQALGSADPKTGEPVPQSLFQFEQGLRKDPRFKQTKQYEDQYANIALGLAQDWGLM